MYIVQNGKEKPGFKKRFVSVSECKTQRSEIETEQNNNDRIKFFAVCQMTTTAFRLPTPGKFCWHSNFNMIQLRCWANGSQPLTQRSRNRSIIRFSFQKFINHFHQIWDYSICCAILFCCLGICMQLT